MMNRDEYKTLWQALQSVRVRIYNAIPDLTPEQRAALATDLEQALARLRGGEAKPLGQRLHEWRLAKSWSIADVAAELNMSHFIPLFQCVEAGPECGVTPSPGLVARIEALIATDPHA
jgi:hypothetical protein